MRRGTSHPKAAQVPGRQHRRPLGQLRERDSRRSKLSRTTVSHPFPPMRTLSKLRDCAGEHGKWEPRARMAGTGRTARGG